MDKSFTVTEKKWQMPDTLIIIFCVALFAAGLTHIIPQGKFKTQDVSYVNEVGVKKTKTVPIPESFQYKIDEKTGESKTEGVPFFAEGGGIGVTNFIYNGMTSGSMWGAAVGVIAFILLVGGAFGVILRTGAVEVGIMSVISKVSKVEVLIIPLLFALFSIGGAIFGMGEEAIAFAMVLIPIVIRLGYDAAVGVLITYVATQIGFATSPMNPFSAVIANGVAGLPPVAMAEFKWGLVVLFTLLGIAFTAWYGHRVKKDPSKSICPEANSYFIKEAEKSSGQKERFGVGQALVILTLLAGLVWMTWGILDKQKGYYLPEIATIFVIIGIVAGVIGVLFDLRGMRMNDVPDAFVNGAKDLLGAALVVGAAKGLVLLLGGDKPDQWSVLNSILFSTSDAMSGLSASVSAWLMFTFQSVFNFFVVSGSGQAALTMPFMAPLADIMNVSRNVAVVAFQLGDGFTNIIVPTSGALIGTLAVARITWLDWAKFVIGFQVLLFLVASAVMVILANIVL